MRLPVRSLAAIAFAAATALAHAAPESTPAAWQAAQRADLAQQALSDRYAAIWSTLSAAQKAPFSARERAWLNEGREQERQACMAHAGGRSEEVARECEAAVLERRLSALSAPPAVTVAR